MTYLPHKGMLGMLSHKDCISFITFIMFFTLSLTSRYEFSAVMIGSCKAVMIADIEA